MNSMNAYALGIITGIEKRGGLAEFTRTLNRLEPLVKAAKAMKARGKTNEELEKFAGLWDSIKSGLWDYVLPTLGEGASWGATGWGLSGGNPLGALAAIPGAGYGLYKAITGGGQPDVPTQLSSGTTSLLRGAGFDPGMFQPIKMPDIPESDRNLLMQMGVNPAELVMRKRQREEAIRQQHGLRRHIDMLMRYAKEEQGSGEAPAAEAKAKAMPFGQFLRGQPGLQQALFKMGPRPMSRMPMRMPRMMYTGGPGQQQTAGPRGTPQSVQDLWYKWYGKSPGQMRAEMEPLTVGAVRRGQTKDFEKYVNRLFS
jgi:hypothetical protein